MAFELKQRPVQSLIFIIITGPSSVLSAHHSNSTDVTSLGGAKRWADPGFNFQLLGFELFVTIAMGNGQR